MQIANNTRQCLDNFLIPFLSEINIIFAPLAATSSILDAVLTNNSSDGAIATTGTPSSTNAIGPCFNSPAISFHVCS